MWFSQSAAWVEIDPATVPDDVEYLGFAFTQFALPVVAGADLDFDFQPAENLRAPAAMLPLLDPLGGRLRAARPRDEPARAGAHDRRRPAPMGMARRPRRGARRVRERTRGLPRADAGRRCSTEWGSDLQAAAGIERRPASANPLTSHLSYWTDNGAAYWYRTEPGRTIADSVADVVDVVARHDVPVRAVELDSWFYRHETQPPDRRDRLPARRAAERCVGVEAARRRVPGAPSRRRRRATRSSASPTGSAGRRSCSTPGTSRRRRPTSTRPTLVGRPPRRPPAWTRRTSGGGSTTPCAGEPRCIEQDWMLIYWFGVRALRVDARSRRGLAAGARRARRATGVDLLWCMATPADLIAAVELDRVIAVRTCDDYRFADDPAMLWTWFLTVNRLSNALGLPGVQGLLLLATRTWSTGSDPIDGDVHAELEALLSAFSAGPVGIGDRIGRTDRDIVMRTCDDDGRLRHTDRAIGLVDDCLFGAPAAGRRLAWATTSSTVTSASGDVGRGRTWSRSTRPPIVARSPIGST